MMNKKLYFENYEWGKVDDCWIEMIFDIIYQNHQIIIERDDNLNELNKLN